MVFGLVVAGAAEWELRERVFQPIRKLDRFWMEFCLGVARPKIGDPSVTMVRITDDYEPVPIGAVTDTGGAAPAIGLSNKELTRLDYAAFLYSIGKLNPKAVSFMAAPVFKEKTVLNETDIYPLKDAALQLPKMTVGTVVTAKGEAGNPGESFQYPGIQVKGDPSQVPEIKKTLTPPDPEILMNGDPAFFRHEELDALRNNGESPRVQLVARQADKVVPGFVLASAARQAGLSANDITLDLEGKRPLVRVGDLYEIPVAADGSMALPSHGGLSHSMYQLSGSAEEGAQKRTYHFASLKVEDVALAAGQVDDVAKKIFSEFAGKFESLSTNLVLLGFDRKSDRTIATLNDEWLSPMTATARAIATIQSGRHTERWPFWIRGVVLGGILLIGLLLLNVRRKGLFWIFLFAGLSLVALVVVFRETLTWSPPAGIFALLALMLFFGLFGFGGGRKKTEYEPVTTQPETESESELAGGG